MKKVNSVRKKVFGGIQTFVCLVIVRTENSLRVNTCLETKFDSGYTVTLVRLKGR